MEDEGWILRMPDGTTLEESELEESTEEMSHDSLIDSGRSYDAATLMRYLPKGEGGVVIHVHLREDSHGHLKPRRPQPLPVRYSEFLDRVVALRDGRYAYSGAGLNGWPALSCMEVRSVTAKLVRKESRLPFARKTPVVRVWDAEDRRSDATRSRSGLSPGEALDDFREPPCEPHEYRVTLRCAPWTLQGWSETSPGCVWWYEAATNRVLFGSGMVERCTEPDAECVHAHLLHHRYALPGGRKETARDRLTWHSLILLEFRSVSSSTFTVVELATLNGSGGRGGKSNWHENRTKLNEVMPNRMKAPWIGSRAEIRVNDVAAKSFEDFQHFVARYTGPKERFLDPTYTNSGPVRLSYRSRKHIMQYLLNYMGRDYRYSEINRNCQTFAADFFAFVAGKSNITPYKLLQTVDYVQRTHLFLYDYNMYENPQ